MATFTSRVRIFTVTGCEGGKNAILAGKATGISVWISVQALPDWAYNADKAGLQQLYNAYGFSNVLGVIVGSEDLYRNDISADLLTQKIYDIKGFLSSIGARVPVTHADVYYLQPPQLIAAVDVVMFNAYAYWEGVNIDGALDSMKNHYAYVQSIANGKPIYIGETGWPDQGPTQASAVASMANVQKYLNDFVCWANSIGLPYLWFEAFDEPWKAKTPTDVEAHWGLYYADHVTKKSGFNLNCPGFPAPSTPTSTPASTSTPGNDLNSALYYSFDGQNSASVADASGNGRTGTVTGSLTYVNGIAGTAGKFTQNPLTYLTAANANTFANIFSISLWMNIPSAINTRMKLTSSKLNWNDQLGFELEFFPTANSLNFVGAGGSVASWTNLGIRFSTWVHVAVSVNGAAVNMYVNGAQVGSTQYVTPVIASSRALYVGSNGQPDGVTGNLDEFHIFNLALSSAQVASIYSGSTAGATVRTSAPTSTSQAPTTSSVPTTSTSQIQTSTSQAPTSSPQTSQVSSTSTPPSTSNNAPTCNSCGAASCCPLATGNACYTPTSYSCIRDEVSGNVALCSAGMRSCNGACYSPNSYACRNGRLVSV